MCYDVDLDNGLVEFERVPMSGWTTSNGVIELIHGIMREETENLQDKFITLDW